jgi:hypothetical protein
MAFGMYGGLSQGAYRALLTHGSEALRRRLLPALVEALDRHHVSYRGRKRLGSFSVAHACLAGSGRQLPHFRQQDLHLRR